MCAFGIDELRQHPAEVLLLWRHAEQHALGAHVQVESLDIVNSATHFDLPRWIFVGSRVQRESSFARHELAPARRFELELEAEHITVELHRLVHVGDELDHVPKLRSSHLQPPLYNADYSQSEVQVWYAGCALSNFCSALSKPLIRTEDHRSIQRPLLGSTHRRRVTTKTV